MLTDELSANDTEQSEHCQTTLGNDKQNIVQFHAPIPIEIEFTYLIKKNNYNQTSANNWTHLEQRYQTGNGVYAIDEQFHDVGLQNCQISVLLFLDEHKEQYQRNDAHDHEEDSSEQALVRLGTVNLEHKSN